MRSRCMRLQKFGLEVEWCGPSIARFPSLPSGRPTGPQAIAAKEETLKLAERELGEQEVVRRRMQVGRQAGRHSKAAGGALR
jgi:hypothetical protein